VPTKYYKSSKGIAMTENSILDVLKQCFEKFIPAEDARTTITPLEFTITLVFCYFGDSKTFSLESIRRFMIGRLNQSISRGAFWERMAGNRLKQNLQSVIAELMGRLAASVQVSETILKQLGVNAIEVVDSSSITLLPGAKNAFPGTRTKASIKWHASFDILTGLLVWFQLTPGKRHDSKCFPEITSLKGKLVIFDLGYWDYAVLHAIEKAEGFFLSRVKSNAVIKIKKVIQGLSKEAIGQSLLSLDLSRKKGNIIEVIIEKIHQGNTLNYRAIGFWNPVEKDYHWYITNLTAAAYLIYPLYRLRWQIELIFKACKNSLNANQITSCNANIIENLLLASIVAHLSTHTVFQIGREQLDDEQNLAISFQRIAKVAVVLARDFIMFLLHSSQEYFKILVNKIKLFANEIFDPNYNQRETSLARIHRLLLEGG
jgi:hypothetical protein